MGGLDSAPEKLAHTCLLLKQGGEDGLKLRGTVASFLQLPQHMPEASTCYGSACPTKQLYTGVRAAVTERRAHLQGTKMAQTQREEHLSRGSHYWFLRRQHIRSSLGI